MSNGRFLAAGFCHAVLPGARSGLLNCLASAGNRSGLPQGQPGLAAWVQRSASRVSSRSSRTWNTLPSRNSALFRGKIEQDRCCSDGAQHLAVLVPWVQGRPFYLNLGPERVFSPLAMRSYSTTFTVAARFMQPSVGI